jgi:hypothetical protein
MEVWGKGVYLLCSEMSALDYLMEMPHSCAADNVNVLAFEEATKIIRRRDAVEEFLACGIWPLSDGWDFKVEKIESPLSKVIVPMPKMTAIIAEKETWAAFEARIASATNQLVGNYGTTKHHACATQLLHDRLNHVSELAGVNYQPRPEPAARVVKNRKASGVEIIPPPTKKIGDVKRWRKASSQTGDKTSEQEVLLVKPLKEQEVCCKGGCSALLGAKCQREGFVYEDFIRATPGW